MDINQNFYMDVIAMMKKSSKVYYKNIDKQYYVKEIFSRCKKFRLLFTVLSKTDFNADEEIPPTIEYDFLTGL